MIEDTQEAWRLLVTELPEGVDLRSVGAVRECMCGSNLWRVLAAFDDDGALGYYLLDMVCSGCGSVAKAPIPEKDSFYNQDEDRDGHDPGDYCG